MSKKELTIKDLEKTLLNLDFLNCTKNEYNSYASLGRDLALLLVNEKLCLTFTQSAMIGEVRHIIEENKRLKKEIQELEETGMTIDIRNELERYRSSDYTLTYLYNVASEAEACLEVVKEKEEEIRRREQDIETALINIAKAREGLVSVLTTKEASDE